MAFEIRVYLSCALDVFGMHCPVAVLCEVSRVFEVSLIDTMWAFVYTLTS